MNGKLAYQALLGLAHRLMNLPAMRSPPLAPSAARRALMTALVTVSPVLVACDEAPAVADQDAGVVDARAADAAPAPVTFAQYPTDRTLSPLSPSVVAGLRAIHVTATGSDATFAKIGDSQTAASGYLTCFATAAVDLAGHDLAGTLAHFKAGDAAGADPFARKSLAAVVGWPAFKAISGAPTPVELELAAIHPTFATIMFGSNDAGWVSIDRFGRNLIEIGDELLAHGVIPIYSSFPPRDDDPAADALVARYNAVVRGVASTRGLPFIDLHRELMSLPAHGLGPDHLHLASAAGGGCKLDPASLGHGNNLRNLLTLETLDRLRATVLDAMPAPDLELPRSAGSGLPADPLVIDAFPYADRRDTRAGVRAIASYPGCSAADEGGPELYYQVTITAPTTLHAYALEAAGVDVDLQLLDAGGACLGRGDTTIDHAVAAGTYTLVVDTFASGAIERGGEYVLVVTTDTSP
jgi:hypothetical protein